MKPALLLASLVATVGLGSLGVAAEKLKGKVSADGSSTVYPLAEAVAEEFLREQPRVRVTVGVSGTGGGFKKFTTGETDISNASRPIKASEAEQAKKHGVGFIELPVAYDGITVVVNHDNDWAKELTFAQLKKLWEPGSKVTKWKDLDPKWPDKEIKLYGPGSDSGTFDYFTEVINGKGGASRSNYTASEDDNVLVTGVSGDKYALGYFGYSYYLENKAKVKDVSIAKTAGKAVEPTNKTVEDGSYPLSRPIFIYVNSKSADRPEVKAYVEFFLGNAKALAKDVGYVPLPDSLYKEAQERFAKKTLGSKQANLL